jgi:hypothetical protein
VEEEGGPWLDLTLAGMEIILFGGKPYYHRPILVEGSASFSRIPVSRMYYGIFISSPVQHERVSRHRYGLCHEIVVYGLCRTATLHRST